MINKAFALTGRLADCDVYPGCCPGLGASALSGRVGLLSIPQSYGFIFKPARDFGEKLQKKLGSHALYQGKICVICVTKQQRINLRDKEQNMFACKHANMQTYKHRKPCLRFLY